MKKFISQHSLKKGDLAWSRLFIWTGLFFMKYVFVAVPLDYILFPQKYFVDIIAA